MNQKRARDIAGFVLGLVLVLIGIALWEKRAGGVLMGLGAGLMGMCAAQLYLGWVVSKDPKLAKQLRIEEQDERAVYINNFAKAKAFDFLHFLVPPFLLILSLARVPLWIVLLGVSVYVVDWVVYFVFHVKKSREI
ncbi:MAG TPA: hypothetical protein GX014_02520 [Firmicutes bacterium]|jgi:hypothetical protein|nr:hypothetical protein [Bacillota bacterium]HHT42263.1 hypothetical protein [Bacillota bacterium]